MEEDSGGLYGIEVEGLDEANYDVEDVTAQYGEDPNSFVIDSNISEEVMLVNSGDLDFDSGDLGMNHSRTVYLKEPFMQKRPIKTKFGTIWCDTHCENCQYISICTRAVDRYISALGDLSAVRKPRCKSGYQLMRHKTTGQYKCVRRPTTAPPTGAPPAACPPGYRLMRHKTTGQTKCMPPPATAPTPSPFARFFIFKKKASDPTWKQASYSLGNFLFFSAVILGIAYITPRVIGIAKSGTDFGIDSWKKIKEVKLLGKR